VKGAVYFVRCCAAYNCAGALSFVASGLLVALGARVPDSVFWLVLPAMFATFAGLALLFAARDLASRASLVYWNGLVRLTFVVAVFGFGLGDDVGGVIKVIALGDLPLAVGAVLVLPVAVKQRHLALLLGRVEPDRERRD
jgi:hypothetical protein